MKMNVYRIIKRTEYTNLSLDELISETIKNKYDKEEWKKIWFEPDIESIYSVSNYGRVRNDKRNYIISQETSRNGYKRVKLYYSNSNCKSYLVHSLVASYFCKIRDDRCTSNIHHIDNDPSNNMYYNLVWVSVKEHMKLHDNESHYNPRYGEDCTTAKHTNAEVCKLCEFIKSNPLISNKEISNLFDFTANEISSIRCGLRWRRISSKYNITNLKNINRKVGKYSDDTIHEVCKMIQEGKSNKEIELITNMSGDSISNIRHGNSHRNISSLYNLNYNKKGKYVRTK